MCRVEPTQLAFVILGASMAALALMILVSILLNILGPHNPGVYSLFFTSDPLTLVALKYISSISRVQQMLKFTYQVTAILATGATRMEVSFFGTISNSQITTYYILYILD